MLEFERTFVGIEEDHLHGKVFVEKLLQSTGSQDNVPEGNIALF